MGTFSRIRVEQTASTGYGRSTESVRFRPQADETRQICQQRSCTVVYLDHCLFNYLGICEIEPSEDESFIDACDRLHTHGEQRPLSNFLVLNVQPSFQATISVYRLAVMYHWTTLDSIFATGPDTLNSPGAKAAFYILHAFPEWLASLVLFSTNVRMVFGTGMFGDWRRKDETAEQRAKREEKERQKSERKAMKN